MRLRRILDLKEDNLELFEKCKKGNKKERRELFDILKSECQSTSKLQNYIRNDRCLLKFDKVIEDLKFIKVKCVQSETDEDLKKQIEKFKSVNFDDEIDFFNEII